MWFMIADRFSYHKIKDIEAILHEYQRTDQALLPAINHAWQVCMTSLTRHIRLFSRCKDCMFRYCKASAWTSLIFCPWWADQHFTINQYCNPDKLPRVCLDCVRVCHCGFSISIKLILSLGNKIWSMLSCQNVTYEYSKYLKCVEIIINLLF